MKTDIIQLKDKAGRIIVKIPVEQDGNKALLNRIERQIGKPLKYLGHRSGFILLWTGHSNIKYADATGPKASKLSRKVQGRAMRNLVARAGLTGCSHLPRQWTKGVKAPKALFEYAFSGKWMSPAITPNLP